MCCARRQRNGHNSILARPDEWQARALVQHARSHNKAAVTHAERKRAVHSRQGAYFESHILADVINNAYVARGILRVDALADDAPCIVDTECSEKVTSVTGCLRNDRRAAVAVDHAALQASAITGADRDIQSVHGIGVSKRLARRQWQL